MLLVLVDAYSISAFKVSVTFKSGFYALYAHVF